MSRSFLFNYLNIYYYIGNPLTTCPLQISNLSSGSVLHLLSLVVVIVVTVNSYNVKYGVQIQVTTTTHRLCFQHLPMNRIMFLRAP